MSKAHDVLIEQIVSELRVLPGEAVQEVLDFVGYLQAKRRRDWIICGSADALLACWGKWRFEPGERAELDAYIQALREMPDDRLSA